MLHCYFIMLLSLLQPETKEIHFGHGGGFSGIVYHYILDNNGHLFKKNAFTNETILIKSIDSHEVRHLFLSIEEDSLSKLSVNHAGNTYKFVEIYQKGGTHKMVWNGKSENNNLNLLYSKLNSIVQPKE